MNSIINLVTNEVTTFSSDDKFIAFVNEVQDGIVSHDFILQTTRQCRMYIETWNDDYSLVTVTTI